MPGQKGYEPGKGLPTGQERGNILARYAKSKGQEGPMMVCALDQCAASWRPPESALAKQGAKDMPPAHGRSQRLAVGGSPRVARPNSEEGVWVLH